MLYRYFVIGRSKDQQAFELFLKRHKDVVTVQIARLRVQNAHLYSGFRFQLNGGTPFTLLVHATEESMMALTLEKYCPTADWKDIEDL